MNIWKDIHPRRITAEKFEAVIEIERGSKLKYELDKETGLLRLDRVLYTSTHYPMNYGFIPLTYCGDHDPLDVFVLCSEPITHLCLVTCYPIGVVTMLDRDESDEKIIAIPFGDPQYNSYKDISDLPQHIFDELMHFLRVYKELEGKKVEVKELGGRDKAIETINKAIEYYKEKRLEGEI